MGKKTDYRKGIWGERYVALWLRLKGWQIIARNYQSPLGEIDIIAKKGNILCAFEVKLRQNTNDDPVSYQQKQRIKHSFEAYIANEPQAADEYRVDLIIYRPLFHVKHIKNAW
ncbi:MAG: YraN family protein [Alphaproteobacteria bacterium]